MADETLDISNLDAETILYDGSGLWVIQFSKPREAKEALSILLDKGITAEPDYYNSYFAGI